MNVTSKAWVRLKQFSKASIACLVLSTFSACTVEPTRQSLEDTPSQTATIYVRLGYAYIEKGKYEFAKRKLTKALVLAPKLPEVHDALGLLYASIDEIQLAEVHYKNAIRLGDKGARWQNNYGTFLCKQKRYAEADALFQIAISDPLYETPAQAYENAALCALESKQRNKAVAYFKKALYHSPERPESLLQLVELTAEDGDYTQAHKYLKRFFLAHGQEVRALWLGYQMAKSEGNEVGEKHFKFALEANYPEVLSKEDDNRIENPFIN